MIHSGMPYAPRPIDLERRKEVLDTLEFFEYADPEKIIHVVDSNPSAGLPYHGTPHLYVVALSVLQLSTQEGLKWEEAKAAFLAGLFHDFDHRMEADDTLNVESAINAVHEHLTGESPERVAELVRATRYPYLTEPASKAESVLRDADILYSTILMPDAQHFRNGLLMERGVPATEQDSLAFVIGHGLYTRTAAEQLHHFMQIGASNEQR